MSLQACADLVARGDPQRFRAAMTAPVAARPVLFPIYAFLLEVARAPWVTQESLIAEMRLQWWRDALEEIGKGGPVRRHEVATPLGEALQEMPELAAMLDQTVEARRWDIYREGFADDAHFARYIDHTAAHPIWAAAQLLGAKPDQEKPLRALGYAHGLARFLQAVPALEAQGRIPLIDGRPEAIAQLADTALAGLGQTKGLARRLGPAASACMEAWEAKALLSKARQSPGIVANQALALPGAGSTLRLAYASIARWP